MKQCHATWIDLEIIILNDIRQQKTNIIGYHLYVESLKRIQMNLFAEHRLTDFGKTYSYQKGKVGVGGIDGLGVWESVME